MTPPPPAPPAPASGASGGGPTSHAPDLDAELLRAAGRGDLEAVRALHRRHAGALLALARHRELAGPEGAVEDLFVLVRLHAACHAGSGLSGRAWLLGLAHLHLRGRHSGER